MNIWQAVEEQLKRAEERWDVPGLVKQSRDMAIIVITKALLDVHKRLTALEDNNKETP